MNNIEENENSYILSDDMLDDCIERNKKIIDKMKKSMNKKNLIIPSKETFLNKEDYSIKELKEIAKHYKEKISGTKKELRNRIIHHFKKNDCTIIIQRAFIKYLYKKYKKLHGPARMNRSICVNETDFYTMELIKDINYNQFISFEDVDGIIYGFNILSLYTLLNNENDYDIKNPYNRKDLPNYLLNNINQLIKLSKILKQNIVIKYEEEKEILSPTKELELFSKSLFQYIDQLGNYTDHNWFWNLDNRQLVRFLYELNDIWFYRAQLTNEMMKEICPPHGNPFMNINININTVTIFLPLFELKRIALKVIEQIVKKSTTNSNRLLGSNYVLCALTLVSARAASSLPWLYYSVVHN